jgi:hypothetical protein
MSGSTFAEGVNEKHTEDGASISSLGSLYPRPMSRASSVEQTQDKDTSRRSNLLTQLARGTGLAKGTGEPAPDVRDYESKRMREIREGGVIRRALAIGKGRSRKPFKLGV